MAGKGSQGPCCEADSSPSTLTSGLGPLFAHLWMGEKGKWLKGGLRGADDPAM